MLGRGWTLVVAVLALAVLAGAAEARERIRTSVTITTDQAPSGREFLKGKVSSQKAKCERNRNVVLYWDDPELPNTFEAVADDASSETGAWRINAPDTDIPPGRYFVRVTRIERRSDVCKPARSRTIRITVPAL
jgi:hypothetical protein